MLENLISEYRMDTFGNREAFDELERDPQSLQELYKLARWHSERSAGNAILLFANNGNHLVEAYLSILYHHGCASFETNKAEAQLLATRVMPWLQSEMLKRNPFAVFHMVCCHLDGRGVMPNVLEAENIAQRYSKQQNEETLLVYARTQVQRRTYGFPAVKHQLERIAEQSSHPEAQYQLGLCELLSGRFCDEEKAFRYFRAAAKQGHQEAIYRTGDCYLQGWGTFRNVPRAAGYFQRGAEYHLEEAQVAYAKCCKEGYGVDRNYTTAVLFYTRAAEKGNVLALHNLGVMYELGRGVPQSKQQAIVCYKRAAELGDYPAKLCMERLVREFKMA